MEEEKDTNTTTPVEETPAVEPTTPVEEPKKPADNGKIEVNIEEMPMVVDEGVELPGDNVILAMVDHLKRYSGYPYCSISRIEKLPKESKKCSFCLNNLLFAYLKKGGSDSEAFKKAYASGDLAMIQVHQSCPTMAEDGLYDAKTVGGEFNKTILVGTFHLNNPKEFQSMVVIRNAGFSSSELMDKPGALSLIMGNPYHQVTAAEAAEVIKETQPDAVVAHEGPETPLAQ